MSINQVDHFDYRRFVYDLFSMVKFLSEQGDSADAILSNVAHDLGGIVRQELCFSPRCTGYDHDYVERENQ